MLILYFIFYQLVSVLALPLVGLYLVMRWCRGKVVFGDIQERLGAIPVAPHDKKVIWLHAVSVGEVLAVQELIARIKREQPGTFIYMTTGTPAGNTIAREQIDADQIVYLPFDLLPIMMRAFTQIHPSTVVIVEAELWPNVIMLAALKKIPIYLINARVLQSSVYRSSVRRFFAMPLLKLFKHIYAQTMQEKNAFEKLGIAVDKVSDFGNIKAFNVLAKRQQLSGEPGDASSYPTLLLGSVHQPELVLYLELFKALRQIYPTLKLIIAPRHFHWKKHLEADIKGLGVSYRLVDQPEMVINHELLAQYDIILVCTIGKLFDLYRYADLFFLGGTFVPIGGHNLLEPAVWGKPTVVGPYYHNSQVIADQLEAAGGLVKVLNPNNLTSTVKRLLEQPVQLAKQGAQAGEWLVREAALVERNVDELLRTWR